MKQAKVLKAVKSIKNTGVTKMSSNAVAPAETGIGFITDNQTITLVKEGDKLKSYPEDRAKELVAEGKAEAILTQTFQFYKATSLTGAHELVPADEEFLALFNRGLATKQQNKVRQIISEVDENDAVVFEPVDGVYDLREVCAEISARRGLTQFEKAMNVLKGLPQDQIAKLLASMQGNVQEG